MGVLRVVLQRLRSTHSGRPAAKSCRTLTPHAAKTKRQGWNDFSLY